VELPGREAPYQEQDDGRETESIWGGIEGHAGLGGRQGSPDDSPTGEPGIHTSQVTASKKHLMTQVAELFADGRQ
jgi:hypothetical protein